MICRVEANGQKDLEKWSWALLCPGLICFFSSFQRGKRSRKVWDWRCCFLRLTHPVTSWLFALGKNKISLCSVWSLDTPMYQRGRNKLQRKNVFFLPTLHFHLGKTPRSSDCHGQMDMSLSGEPFALLKKGKPRLMKLICLLITQQSCGMGPSVSSVPARAWLLMPCCSPTSRHPFVSWYTFPSSHVAQDLPGCSATKQISVRYLYLSRACPPHLLNQL